MFDRVLNVFLNDSSRLDRLSKYVLLRKPSIFIVLPIIRNQSQTKTISRAVFETFINSKSFFIKNHYYNLFKCYLLKNEKRFTKKMRAT